MSAFKAVNTTLAAPEPLPGRPGEETTPTTPRPNSTFFRGTHPSDDARAEDPSAKTPTRNSFALSSQQPLPSTPFAPSQNVTKPSPQNGTNGDLNRGNSHRSTKSLDSQDIDMGRDDEDRDGSDNESVTSDANRPSKKKKGQRFFCTDFPPCTLSFTRSEHLARHIRKHTGERPFQCHCSRRFSRLDNLRQHAQTVHVNDDIPADSLAATGTRFQRQIRTERVRPAGARARASTLGSQGGHSRGHSRNLSTSSTISTASTMSMGTVQDIRRRPQPLAMANDPAARARLSLSTMDAYNPPLMGSPGPQIVEYTDYQSTGATTPTSATFSTANGSPGQFGSAFQSPVSNSSRPVSWAGPGTPARRLSVASNGEAYAGPPPGQLPPPFASALGPSPSTTAFTQNSSYAGHGASNAPESRRESISDSDWRRRTWHPGYTGARPATSGLGYHQTPDAPRPSFTSQPAASQTRLPGIESFDLAPPPPALTRRPGSPMQMDSPAPRPVTQYGTPESYATRGEKRKSISWDTETVQQRIHRLEIASPNPPREQWSQYQRHSGQYERPVTAPHPSYMSSQQPAYAYPPAQAASDQARTHGETPTTPRNAKRQAWYQGPVSSQPPQLPSRLVQRTSPEDSSSSEGVPTPSATSMAEYHPAIVHSSGYADTRPPVPPTEDPKAAPPTSIMNRPHPLHQQHSSPFQFQGSSHHSYHARSASDRPVYSLARPLPHAGPRDTTRLDALVAVATSEQQAVADGGR